MKKAVDWTKLESYVGLTWEQTQETMRTCGHMLAFGPDAWAIDVVKTFEGTGNEAGMAALSAALFIKKHGAGAAATAAVEIYRAVAKELKRSDLSCRVENMAFMVYFANHSGVRKLEWPIPWPFEDVRRRAGQANVMLGLAMQELLKGGSTSETVAAFGIQRFMDEGREKLEGRRNATKDMA